MPVPLLVVAGFKAGAGIIKSRAGSKARKKLREARKYQRVNAQLLAAQRRRSFIRRARAIQADALLQGSVTGADFGSSALQGNLASLATQEATSLGEFKDTELRNRKIGILTDSAQNTLARGQQAANVLGTAGDILGEFV